MLKITIPTPCHEDWNNMAANQQGRHCSSCCKTVVDFTKMTDDEVRHFLINKKEEKVCGRFTSNQLNSIHIELPQNIFYIEMPWWKQFLVASLIVFSTTLFSCEVNTMGEPLANQIAISGLSFPKTQPAIYTDTTNDPGPRNQLEATVVAQMAKQGFVIPPHQQQLVKMGEVRDTSLPKPPACNVDIQGDIEFIPVQSIDPEIMIGEPAVVPVRDTASHPAEPEIMGKIAMPPKRGG